MDDVDFHDFMEMTPLKGKLTELKLYIPPLSLSTKPDISVSFVDRLRHVKTLVLPSIQFGPMSFESLVHSSPMIEIFKIGDNNDFYSFNEQNAFKYVSGLGLIDLNYLSAWKFLKECLLIVDVDDHGIHIIPSIEDHPPGIYREFPETFIILKDKDLVPRLKAEWAKECPFLMRLEVIASVYDFGRTEHSFRPLIYATRCGVGTLHFP